MPQTWPTLLPDCPQGWSQVDIPMVIRSEVDVGPAKVRRRYTRERVAIQCSLTLTKDKYNAFMAFFRTTLKDGLLTFNYKHPYDGNLLEVRFVEPPQIQMTAKAFQVSMSWETI